MNMKKILAELLNDLCQYVDRSLSGQHINYRDFSEATIALVNVDQKLSLDALNQAALRLLINKSESFLRSKYANFYIAWYYLPTNVYKHEVDELTNNISTANIQITQFRSRMALCQALQFSLDSSEDGYFFSRGDSIIRAVSNFLLYPFEFDLNALVYLILNYYQALKEYELLDDNTYSKRCTENINHCELLFYKILSNNGAVNSIRASRQLNAFWNSTVPADMHLNSDILISFTNSSVSDVDRWVLISLFKTDPLNADQLLRDNYSKIFNRAYGNRKKDILNIRLLVASINCSCDNDVTSEGIFISVTQEGQPIHHDLKHFFNNYLEIGLEECSQAEIALLESYSDTQLRSKVAACLINVDPAEVARQMRKPHGALEIADMEIQFRENKELKYLCMPFKTGIEIKGSSVPENIAYQVYKPFSHFGNQCMVVFVSVKPCSLGLDAYIKRMSRQQPNWKVGILQSHQLGRLLKLNQQLN